MATRATKKISVYPLTPDRWGDLETLFGARGACGGCWCITWRLPRSRFIQQKGAGNKRAFKKIVNSGEIPGLLAYIDGHPIGWCAIAPRPVYPALARSRVLAPVDDQPVWSITCFFIARPYRRRGISVRLLEATIKHARRHGAKIIEGYPTEPSSDRFPDAFIWTGTGAAFRRAGFVEVARRSPARPIVRYAVKK